MMRKLIFPSLSSGGPRRRPQTLPHPRARAIRSNPYTLLRITTTSAPAAAPLVVVDADVLGRRRTGDETYVENLLRRLPDAAGGAFRLAAVTRHPELVPEGVEPVELPA